jgi:glycosyltransferase involved in cell wall biosynthesis
MTIKTRKTDAIDRIQKAIAEDSRIKFEIGDSHPDFVKRYYYAHDCLLWLSKGEGVGLPPLEAMSTGMEVVCSTNSGMLDYVKDEHCYPVSTSHMEPADCPGGFESRYTEQFGAVGNWWVPDENHAVKQLRRCFNNWALGNGKGARAASYVRQNHTLEIQSESVLKIIEQYE